jgi:pimeloyl-ACP methyl ester carboxylesterase
MATFVLIHGASVGGWCWTSVTPLLWKAGHVVYAPTLTGLGHRSHLANPSIDLETHIEDVVQVLEFEDLRDVILVGWSYGGMPITGAADQMLERISRLVYLDADVPRDGEISSTSPDRMAERERYARESGDGWRAYGLPPDVIASILRETMPAELVDWTVNRLIPQPLKCWTQPIRLSNPALTEIPHVFIRCLHGYDENDLDAVRSNHRMATEPCWTRIDIEADHFAPLSKPQLVAETLIQVAETDE